MVKRLLIGITGYPGTGKTTASEHLVAQGFYMFEGSTEIAQAAAKNGLKLKTRQDYNRYHRQMQLDHGIDWLAQLLLSLPEDRIVFSGIRNVHNAKRLQAEDGKIVSLVCPPEICLQRIDRTNPKNPQSVQEYLEQVTMDDSQDDYGANTTAVMSLADYQVDTSHTIEHTQHQLDTLLHNYESRAVIL